MTPSRRGVTVIVQPDGAGAARAYRLPAWGLRALIATAALLPVAAIALLVLYGPTVRTAARVPGLERKIARLEADNGRIRDLAAALDSVEARYAQVRDMIGANIVREPLVRSSSLPTAPPVRAAGLSARFGTGSSEPTAWPLDDPGYLTRGQVGESAREESHPGIDIAMPIGSIVRASGGGTVADAGNDPEYGLFVLLQHPGTYQSMYGHLSRVVVTKGQMVEPGSVLGLTGNSGRSTAPHLHFEVRHGNESVDPMLMIKENR